MAGAIAVTVGSQGGFCGKSAERHPQQHIDIDGRHRQPHAAQPQGEGRREVPFGLCV